MREFRTSQLIDMKKSLENILDIVKSGLEMRSKLIEYKGYNDLECQRNYSEKNPEEYYYVKLFDIGCSIIRDSRRYDNKTGKSYNSTDMFYHVRCYGFVPDFIHNTKLLPIGDFAYGEFKELDDALTVFPRFVMNMFKIKGVPLQSELSLFVSDEKSELLKIR